MNFFKPASLTSFLIPALSVLVALIVLELWSSFIVQSDEPGLTDFAHVYTQRLERIGVGGFSHWRPIAAPFFGFVSSSEFANNFGFHSPVSFPYQPKKNEFVIGVFGASVAEGFFLLLTQPKFSERLHAALPRIGSRKIVFLNFALGCFKSPQQFIAATYFSESYHMSINLDGYNEIAFVDRQEPPETPCWAGALYSRRAEAQVLKDRAADLRQHEAALTRLFRVPWVSWSSAGYLLWKNLYARDEREIHRLNETALNMGMDTGKIVNPEPEKSGARNWEKYLRFQARLSEQQGKEAIFLLQPNQHDLGSKPLAEDELKLWRSLPDIADRRQKVSRGYGYLRAAVARVKKQGIRVFDFTDTFNTVREPLYIDDCCHINSRGNELLVERLLSALKDLSQQEPSFPRVPELNSP